MPVPARTTLLSPAFVLFLLGLSSTALADAMLSVALPFAVLAQGGTQRDLALVVLCGSMPRFAAMALGVLADRLPVRAVLSVSAGLRTLLVLGVGWATLHDRAGIFVLAVFALLNSLLVTLTVTTGSVVVPRLVPGKHLAQGNSLVGAASLGLPLVGFGVGGLLVHLLGSAHTLLLTALLYPVMALVAAVLRREAPDPAVRHLAFLSELAEGWRVRRRSPVLLYMLLLTFFLNLCLNILNVRSPLFASAAGNGAGDYALIEALFSGGGLLGIAAVGLLSGRTVPGTQIASALVVFTLGMLAHAVPQLPVWLVASAVTGLAIGLLDVASMTQMQLLVPDGLRGRIMGTSITTGAVGLTLGAAAAGLPVSTTGLMSGLGVVLALLTAGWIWQRQHPGGPSREQPA